MIEILFYVLPIFALLLVGELFLKKAFIFLISKNKPDEAQEEKIVTYPLA